MHRQSMGSSFKSATVKSCIAKIGNIRFLPNLFGCRVLQISSSPKLETVKLFLLLFLSAGQSNLEAFKVFFFQPLLLKQSDLKVLFQAWKKKHEEGHRELLFLYGSPIFFASIIFVVGLDH